MTGEFTRILTPRCETVETLYVIEANQKLTIRYLSHADLAVNPGTSGQWLDIAQTQESRQDF